MTGYATAIFNLVKVTEVAHPFPSKHCSFMAKNTETWDLKCITFDYMKLAWVVQAKYPYSEFLLGSYLCFWSLFFMKNDLRGKS